MQNESDLAHDTAWPAKTNPAKTNPTDTNPTATAAAATDSDSATTSGLTPQPQQSRVVVSGWRDYDLAGITSVRTTQRVFGIADRFGADQTSDLVAAGQE
jgi:hypothetical protein